MKKILLLCAGWLLIAIAFIGIFVPVLPTTPFVILAAVCFSYCSPRAHAFLLGSRLFGPYIEHYRTKSGVSRAHKARAIITLWALLIIGAVSMKKGWAYALFPMIGIGVSAHLLMLKTRKEPESAPEPERMPEA